MKNTKNKQEQTKVLKNQETTPIMTEDLSDEGESSYSSSSNSMDRASIDPEEIKEIVTTTITEILL